MDTRHTPEAGFTLIEIMVVIAIIGLIASMVAVNVTSHLEEARLETARVSVGQIYDAARMYYVKRGCVPNMQDLIDPPPELEGFTRIPRDPWDSPYVIRPGDTPTSWEVLSLGPDRMESTDDDISSRSRRDRDE
jgi:general secretion pathway protein G